MKILLVLFQSQLFSPTVQQIMYVKIYIYIYLYLEVILEINNFTF